MVGFWRSLYILLSHRRRGALALFDTSRITLRVTPGEIDFNLHMNNGRYFSAADMGRLDWGLRSQLWRRALQHGWRPVAGDSNARFSRSLQPFDKYHLDTRLLGWDHKWMFCEHRFVRRGRVYATVLVRYLFVSKHGKVPPAVVLEKAGHPTQSPALPDYVLRWNDAQELLTTALRTPAGA